MEVNGNEFYRLLEQVQKLPEDQKEKLMWELRRQNACKESGKLDQKIFDAQSDLSAQSGTLGP